MSCSQISKSKLYSKLCNQMTSRNIIIQRISNLFSSSMSRIFVLLCAGVIGMLECVFNWLFPPQYHLFKNHLANNLIFAHGNLGTWKPVKDTFSANMISRAENVFLDHLDTVSSLHGLCQQALLLPCKIFCLSCKTFHLFWLEIKPSLLRVKDKSKALQLASKQVWYSC